MSAVITQDDLKRLEQLYTEGFRDTFLDTALRKVVARQIARDEADLTRVDMELARFEKQFGQTSDVFYQRFQSGQIADDADMMEWNALCKMRKRIISRLVILRGDGANK